MKDVDWIEVAIAIFLVVLICGPLINEGINYYQDDKKETACIQERGTWSKDRCVFP
jgi:hypothetical protein